MSDKRVCEWCGVEAIHDPGAAVCVWCTSRPSRTRFRGVSIDLRPDFGGDPSEKLVLPLAPETGTTSD